MTEKEKIAVIKKLTAQYARVMREAQKTFLSHAQALQKESEQKQIAKIRNAIRP
ncbi:hypothetical protein HY627_01835 [Candidatus Uhrbacteria bacterium]|nr:hypothetical protein [Candidatus Uhrbacteria bacterium]